MFSFVVNRQYTNLNFRALVLAIGDQTAVFPLVGCLKLSQVQGYMYHHTVVLIDDGQGSVTEEYTGCGRID
jgi:hypothetical protein